MARTARVAVGFQQPVEQRRDVRQEHARLREIRQILQREILAIDADGAVDAGRAGRGELQPVLDQPGAVDFEQLDVDDNLRPRLVDRRNQPARSRHALGCVLDRQRICRGNRGEPPVVDHDAEQIERLLDVGVAQVERPDDLVLVLRPLGGRIGDDGDGSLRGDAVKVARRRRK